MQEWCSGFRRLKAPRYLRMRIAHPLQRAFPTIAILGPAPIEIEI
jgi:hypothetical protein